MSTDAYIFAQRDGTSYRAGGPLVFTFHGTGGNEQQFLQFAADAMPEARIIAPRGDVSEMGAARFFRRTGEGRYDFEDLATRTQKMANFISAHVQVNAPSAVIGLGYSNGANILISVIDKHAELFTHSVLMHPLVTWDMAAGDSLEKVKTLITAGGRDPICPPDLTGKLADMIETRGGQLKSWWHAGGHEITQDEINAVTVWLNDVRAGIEGQEHLPVKQEDNGTKGRWYIRTQSGHEAEMSYTRGKAGSVIIDHTEVPDVFRGQGVGSRLFFAMVEAAREAQLKVVPLCPYVAAQFKRHPETQDVIDKSIPLMQ